MSSRALCFCILIIFPLLVFQSCGGPDECQKLQSSIKKMLMDNQIDQTEYAKLTAIINQKANLLERAGCPLTGHSDLVTYIKETALTRRNAPDGSITIANETSNKPVVGPLRFNFYLESSASMFPYAKSNSEFKNSIYDLLTRIPDNKNDENRMFYISNDAFEIDGGVREFIQTDDPYHIAKTDPKIKTGSTDINEIFKLLLASENRDKISILISDCIYSINGKNALSDLDKLQFLTKDIFQPRAKNYSVLVIQLNSAYSGTYYDYNNTRHSYNGTRPYYMILIGKTDLMNEMLTSGKYSELANFKTLKGFKNYHLFTPPGAESVPHYSVLPTTEKMGEFRPDRDLSTANSVKGIVEAKARKRDDKSVLQFSVAMDLRNIQANSSYLTDASNYAVGAENPFSIVSVQRLSTASYKPNDKRYTATATHMITVVTDKISVQQQDLRIALRKTMPAWIKEASTADDRNILTDQSLKSKTFGLSYMLDGINRAYFPNGNTSYFTINVSIKK